MDMEGLFSWLIEEPFINISYQGKNLLIVIDALDECRPEDRYKLTDLIVQHSDRLPPFIRFLITTRPEMEISHKLERFRPMLLEPKDERNINDIRLYVEDKLKRREQSISRSETIVEKSGGLMICASILCEFHEDDPLNLLSGIEEMYKSYFNRIEVELGKLGVNEEKFLLLLSAIAVAKEPLPLPIVDELFTPKRNLRAGRTLLKLKSRVSLVFVIKHECISFFHKSVSDWLVQPERDHMYKINEKRGHDCLAKICVSQIGTIKQKEAPDVNDPATLYALQHGVSHMLKAEIKTLQVMKKWLREVTDLETVHVSVCNDVYTTLNNFVSITNWRRWSEMEEMHEMIETLITLIRNFIKISNNVPQSFLKFVADENIAELSSKANVLLFTRYRKFESEGISYLLSDKKIACVDISEAENYLVCGYKNGSVEMFSLSDFKPLWKINKVVAEQNMTSALHGISRFVVFHPFNNYIFPGNLDHVLNFKGNFESWPLKLAEESDTTFSNCCFSPEKRKLVTYYQNHLTVWNVFDKDSSFSITSFSCQSELYSMLFSANGHFLATTNIDGFYVYDTRDNYTLISNGFHQDHKVLISTFNSDSWYCKDESKMQQEEIDIVKYDLKRESVSKGFRSLPMNAKAAKECQELMKSNVSTLTDKLNDHSFFALKDNRILAFRYGESELKLFKLTDMIQGSASSL